MHINECKGKLALFSTKYNVLLTPLPFQFYLSPQSLLHNFIIFPSQCFYSLLHNFYYFPSSSSSSFLLFSLLLLLIFIAFPPPPHFYCFPSTTTTTTATTFLLFSLHHHHHHRHHIFLVSLKRPKRPKSGLKGQTQGGKQETMLKDKPR